MNAWLTYWMTAPLAVALALAVAFHIVLYVTVASLFSLTVYRLFPALGIGALIDPRPLKPGQLKAEIGAGIRTACVIGVVSLLFRSLSEGIWSSAWWHGLLLFAAYMVFNELVFYPMHRLLHTRRLARYHVTHHRSVQMTPWSGYRVSVLDALIQSATLPLFALMVPLGIGTVLVFQTAIMALSAFGHSNFDPFARLPDQHWLKRRTRNVVFHQRHHQNGKVNYGNSTPLLDRLFGTELRE